MDAIISIITDIIDYFYGKTAKILLKNKYFLVIDKDYDLKINSNDKQETTVQTIIKKKYPYLADTKLYHNFYFAHRLDYATSGIMCIPLNKRSCRAVSETFQRRTSRKYYLVLARGLFSQQFADVCLSIGKDATASQKMCVLHSKHCMQPQYARTMMLVLEHGLYDNYPATKLLVRPITGRRHQIRVHLNFLGHTIVGDYTYSNRKDLQPKRMYLHAVRLVLPNPLFCIDIQTSDPFSKDWTSVKVFNTLDEQTYMKLDRCLYRYSSPDSD